MTTATTTTVADQSTDAAFRVWGLEFSTQLAAVGLVQTADTGQINWASVTRASANNSAGYEIWRFADSSLYMKMEYGSAGANTIPQMWLTAGTGSNGSGTITGQTNTRATFLNGTAPTSTTTTSISRFCHVTDAFAVCWKEAYGGTSTLIGGLLVVGKTVDGAGAATTVGFGVLRNNIPGSQVLSFQSVRIAATAATFNDTPLFGLLPGTLVNTAIASTAAASGNKQAYDIFLNVPDVLPFAWANVILVADAGRGTSFAVAQVGAVSHTYASTGQPGVQGMMNGNYPAASYGIGYIFE